MHQVRSACMASKVKSVVEFQGEKYINSKILFCNVIEFLINHSLIPNKTSHNLFIWNWRFNDYFWMFPIVFYWVNWINKVWKIKSLSRRFCFYYCKNLEGQEAGPPLGPLVPTALLQTVRSLRREFPWDYWFTVRSLRREFPWDYWFQSWWVSSTLSSSLEKTTKKKLKSY